MSAMRAVVIDRFGGPEVMVVRELDEPGPAAGEVAVRVRYAGLNPVDHKMRDGSNRLARRMELPAGLGREVSGELAGAGDGVDLDALGLGLGGLVCGGRGPDDVRGCYQQVVVLPAERVAALPADADDALVQAAAALPVAGLTALAAVERHARVQPGDLVLVHGGSGGVGQLVVQLAVAAGARVWATGRAANAARLRALSAEPIAHDQQDWQAVVDEATGGRGMDAIIDTHYHSTFVPSLDHVAPGGRVAVLPTLADLAPAEERGVEASIVEATGDRHDLARLVGLVSSGQLDVEVSDVVGMGGVRAAHERLEQGHTRGKLLLDPSH